MKTHENIKEKKSFEHKSQEVKWKAQMHLSFKSLGTS
jgi:hypothetical protein